MQNRTAVFGYAFVAGIALVLTAAGSDAVGAWRVAAAVVTGLALAFAAADRWGYGSRLPPRAWRMAGWGLTALAGLVLGGWRLAETDATGRPTPLAAVDDAGGVTLRPGPPAGTGWLHVRRAGPADEAVELTLAGEVAAYLPDHDETGTPVLDAQGRWVMRRGTAAQRAEAVRLGAEETAVTVAQPFTTLESVGVEGDPGPGLVVERLPARADLLAHAEFQRAPVQVLGQVLQDPQVYESRVALVVRPAFIQPWPGGPFLRAEPGDIRITVHDTHPLFGHLAGSHAYGAHLALEGRLLQFRGAAAPGLFDARRFHGNHGIRAMLVPSRGDTGIRIVRLPDGRLGRGRAAVALALGLRDRMLATLRHTMPYPASAFLGGVTLGLRHGLQDAELGAAAQDEGEGGSLIIEDFRAAGVNHVLAVSGLHVTILTAMFVGLFTVMRLPRRLFVPGVVAVLLIFTLLTGARPSTVRAAVMNSLVLLAWAYGKQDLKGSALFAVPAAGLFILARQPRLITEPSLTLSFGAVLALALLTEPAHQLLSRLRGWTALLAVLLLTGFTAAAIGGGPAVFRPGAAALLLLAAVGLLVALDRWQERRRLARGRPPARGFADLPAPIAVFVAAQVAIQVGMMLPLSAWYFMRWPVAGAYANLLAIPLVGIVVQLGVLAGLVGLIPGVGLLLALWLNAANWVFAQLFLWTAHIFAQAFPYPFIARPSLRQVAGWYAVLAALLALGPLRARLPRLHPSRRRPAWILWGAGLVAAGAVLAVPRPERPARGTVRVEFLPVGFGGSALITTPSGRRILADAGYRNPADPRSDVAIRTILPALSVRHALDLDGFLVTSPTLWRAGGAPTILSEASVRAAWAVPGAGIDGAGELRPGQTLFEETGPGGGFRVRTLGEAGGAVALRIEYGDTAFLLTGDADPRTLSPQDLAGSHLVTAPGHGLYLPDGNPRGAAWKEAVDARIGAELVPLLDRTGAAFVVAETGYLREGLPAPRFLVERATGLARRAAEARPDEPTWLTTDDHGLLAFESDGRELRH